MPVAFLVFIGFLALVFLMGGGSRDDIASLPILRPACALIAAYAVTIAMPGQIARVRFPLILIGLLALWMVIQLLPLPVALWSALPGRAAIAATDQLLGLGDVWRPISLSPSKTVNALGSLIVPVAALLLYAVQDDQARRRIPVIFIAIAAVSAAVGIAQIGTGGAGALYLYAKTNLGTPVGLFSNRNHHAAFEATMLVLIGWYFADRRLRAERTKGAVGPLLVGAALLLSVFVTLFSGSRAGLLIGLLAAGVSIALWFATPRGDRRESHHGELTGWRVWLPSAAAVVIALAVVAYLGTRSTSFDRLVQLSAGDELRVQIFPQISAMANDHWLFGTGFGAFEHAYRQYEASDWLRTTYVNNAHDDWAQWVIEGGLPAILSFLAFAVWMVRRLIAVWRERQARPGTVLLVATATLVLGLMLIASVFDYPLRVPSLMVYAVLLVALVADPPLPLAARSRSSSRRGRN